MLPSAPFATLARSSKKRFSLCMTKPPLSRMPLLCSAGGRKNQKGPAVSGRALRFGGASRDRTGDLYNAIVALSQLSYDPGKVVALIIYSSSGKRQSRRPARHRSSSSSTFSMTSAMSSSSSPSSEASSSTSSSSSSPSPSAPSSASASSSASTASPMPASPAGGRLSGTSSLAIAATSSGSTSSATI